MKNEKLTLVIAFILALSVSSLLLTIEWFTWGAWIFVALMLTWKFCLVNAGAHNTAGLWQALFNKLKETNDRIDTLSTRLSTKTSPRKRTRKINKKINDKK